MNNIKDKFLINDDVTYLNHGSFGACPKPIFNDYQKWQLLLEREPVKFFTEVGPEQLLVSKKSLANYIHCDSDDLIYTTNPTYAINIIAKSMKLSTGDEILTTNQEYGAMNRTWKYYCGKSGAKYIQQNITLPIESKEQIVDQFFGGYTSKTKAIFISHMTSPTALIFPVKEICERAKELGLLTIVDGAHIPGHLPLNLSELQADIYTGACHKWMLAPKGCAFLYVKKELQNNFDPLLISWGYESDTPGPSRFIDYHQMQGTRDFSAFLTIPAAISFMEENNWEVVAKECRKMILLNYPKLCDIAGSNPICPLDENFLGQMCSIPVSCKNPVAFKQLLTDKYRIEIPVFSLNEKSYLRVSINGYNTQHDINRLDEVLHEVMTSNVI
jgi:isopenicillin-N epimerase